MSDHDPPDDRRPDQPGHHARHEREKQQSEQREVRSSPGHDPIVPLNAQTYASVTTTFRQEDDTWKLAHRHADPISTPDPEGPLRAT